MSGVIKPAAASSVLRMEQALRILLRRGKLDCSTFCAKHQLSESEAGDLLHTLKQLGARVAGGSVVLPDHMERLHADCITAKLNPSAAAWLQRLTVLPVIDSTNSWVARQAQPVGRVAVAEVQSQGRGRRGRLWSGFLGDSVALSLGFDRTGYLSGISSLSLAAGLGVVDALTTMGIEGVELKWPNDLLLGGAKLGGILMEMHTLEEQTLVVIGIGLNVGGAARLQSRWNRPVADLSQQADQVSRTQLISSLINSLVDFSARHKTQGFAPFRDSWQGLHHYQGKRVAVTAGSRVDVGVVAGVSVSGELILETTRGMQQFSAGEVSLAGLNSDRP